jgi:hypothetical protein
MITVDTEAHKDLLWAKELLRKTGVRDPTHSVAVRWLTAKRQEQLETDLEESIETRSCQICKYRVDASEPSESAEELMQDHFHLDHGYDG